MKKISKITTQKKNKHRFNVFLENGQSDEYAFSIDADMLVKYNIRKGLVLSEEDLEKLQQQNDIQKGYGMALRFLSYRMRTKKEVHDYLFNKEVDPEKITEIIERLENEKLLDDREFANAFVRDRMEFSTKGPKMIIQELIKNGVSQTQATEAAEVYSYEQQYEKTRKLAEKRLHRSTNKSFKQQLEQLHAHLLQKGFSNEVVRDVLNHYRDEKDTEGEWEALLKQGEKVWQKNARKYEGFTLQMKVKEALYRKGFELQEIEKFIEGK